MDSESIRDHNRKVLSKMQKAAINGQLERVQKLSTSLQANEETDERHGIHVASWAAKGGHLHILRWLRVQRPKFFDYSYLVHCATASGHLHILQWVQQQPSLETVDVFGRRAFKIFVQAALHGHLHIIQWLREQDPPCPWEPPPQAVEMDTFAVASDLHIMRWLYENGFPWKQQYGTQYMRVAAGKGDLKALEWAQSQHPPFVMDETVCGATVYLDVWKWLRTHDPPCPWNDDDQYFAQRAISIQEHLTRCGLTGEVAVLIADIVSEMEI